MGTKNNPGKYDCYAKLGPDEPYFTLRAKDPMAPITVLVWQALSCGDYLGAFGIILDEANMAKPEISFDQEKMKEALRCAEDMGHWNTDQINGD